jgi:hypothetical protein
VWGENWAQDLVEAGRESGGDENISKTPARAVPMRSEGVYLRPPRETEGPWVLGFRGFWGRPWAGLVDQNF